MIFLWHYLSLICIVQKSYCNYVKNFDANLASKFLSRVSIFQFLLLLTSVLHEIKAMIVMTGDQMKKCMFMMTPYNTIKKCGEILKL